MSEENTEALQAKVDSLTKQVKDFRTQKDEWANPAQDFVNPELPNDLAVQMGDSLAAYRDEMTATARRLSLSQKAYERAYKDNAGKFIANRKESKAKIMKDYFSDDESNLNKAREQAASLLGDSSKEMSDRDLGVFFKMKQKMAGDGASVAETAKSNETKSSADTADKSISDAGIKWDINKDKNKSVLTYKFGQENRRVEVDGTDATAARQAVFKAMSQAPNMRDELYGFYKKNFKG